MCVQKSKFTFYKKSCFNEMNEGCCYTVFFLLEKKYWRKCLDCAFLYITDPIQFSFLFFCMKKVVEKVVNTLLILDLYWMLKFCVFLGNLAAKAVFKLLYVTRIQVVSLQHVKRAPDVNIVNPRIFSFLLNAFIQARRFIRP